MDWNKYGENNFKFSLLEEISDIDKLKERELYWINKFNSVKMGYNLTDNTGVTKKDKNILLVELKNNFQQLKYEHLVVGIQNRDYWRKDIKRLNREINLYSVLPVFCNVLEYYLFPKINDKIIEDKLNVNVDIDTFYSDFDIKFFVRYTEIEKEWRNTILISVGEILKLSKKYKIDYEKTIIKCISSEKYRNDW